MTLGIKTMNCHGKECRKKVYQEKNENPQQLLKLRNEDIKGTDKQEEFKRIGKQKTYYKVMKTNDEYLKKGNNNK